MAQKTPNTLPPIQTLFSDSWTTFKASILNLFILNIVSFGIILGIIIIGILVSLPFVILPIQAAIKHNNFNPLSFGAVGVIILIVIIAMVILCLAIHAASIFFVGKYNTKPTFGKTLKMSFGFILPLFLLGLLSSLIIVGGYFLFVIPGIFLGILFSFAPYEIVLNNQGVLSSMRRSMRIVLTNFWGVLARIILWVIIVMVIYFIPGLMTGNSTFAQASVSVLSFFVNIFLGWYGICYSVTLYKQASYGLEQDKGSKILWPVITGIIGWIIGIIMLVALTSVIILVANNMAKKNTKPKTYQINQEQQTPSYAPLQQGTNSAR